jgi:hypothetical protein
VVLGLETSPEELDHRLLWVEPETAADLMAHESHAWILRSYATGRAIHRPDTHFPGGLNDES